MNTDLPLKKLARDRRRRERDSVDRRRSERWSSNRLVRWRHDFEDDAHTGRLLSRSLDGFVVLIDTNDLASPFRRIVAVDHPYNRLAGFRTAVVRRHEITPVGIILYAEVES